MRQQGRPALRWTKEEPHAEIEGEETAQAQLATPG